MDATDVLAVDDVDLGGRVGDRCGTGRSIEDVVEHELELVGVVLGVLVHGGVVRGGAVEVARSRLRLATAIFEIVCWSNSKLPSLMRDDPAPDRPA